MQLSLGIHTHTRIYIYIYIYLLKSLGTYMLFTMLTSMVDYFVIFWYRGEKPKQDMKEHSYRTWRPLLPNSHFLQNCLCT